MFQLTVPALLTMVILWPVGVGLRLAQMSCAASPLTQIMRRGITCLVALLYVTWEMSRSAMSETKVYVIVCKMSITQVVLKLDDC